jgi:hypothetical protein
VPSWISVDGTVTEQDDLVLTSTGEAWVQGRDYLFRTQTDGQDKLVWGELRRGDELWRRDFGVQPWTGVSATDGAGHPRLFDVLASLTTLEAVGGETLDGEPVLRYRAPATTPLDLVTFFHSRTADGEPDEGTLDVLARADGTPVRIEGSLTSDDFVIELPEAPDLPSQLRTYEFSFDLASLGEPVTLPDPAEAVRRFEALRAALSIDLPAGFEAAPSDPASDELILVEPDLRPIMVRFLPGRASRAQAKDQDELLRGVATWAVQDFVEDGATLVSVESIEIDRRPAYLVALSGQDEGVGPFFHLEAIVVRGRDVAIVTWHAPPGWELADRFRFEQALATVVLD